VKKHLMMAAKLLVSLGLLAYLFSTTDLTALLRRVRTGDLLLLSVAVLLYTSMQGLAAWRWRVLLAAQGYPAPLRQLTASYLIATFFNNFLPSNVGGDVIRVRDSSQLTGSTTASLAIVAIDRVLGLLALYVLAGSAWLLAGPAVRDLPGAAPALAALGAGFLVAAFLFFRAGTARRLVAISPVARHDWSRQRFEVVQAAVQVYREKLASVWVAFGASLVLQSSAVLYFFFVAHALGIDLPLGPSFVIIPLCFLVQTVPISFNGWGVRESLFIVYFGQIGLSRDSALAFSLVGAGLNVLLSLSGAVVWAARGTTVGEAE
jgi:uncharacterized protein (TIRG00374 family)